MKIVLEVLQQASVVKDIQHQWRLYPTLLRADHWMCLLSGASAIIEMDGMQHFEPVDFFGGEKSLVSNRARDVKKEEWCHANNVHMLRIDHLVSMEQYDATVRAFIADISSAPSKIHVQRVGTRYTTPMLDEDNPAND